MPLRTTYFASEQIYHIFNRGVAKLPIFSSPKDYQRFIELVNYYRFSDLPFSFSHFKKLPGENRREILDEIKEKNHLNITVLAHCLMPNHFHFLIRQVEENGIRKFMANVQNGYAKYYNISTERVGPLFQSTFKAILIESDEHLLHVSRYMHLNPSTSYLVSIDDLLSYPWSSLPQYVLESVSSFVETETILGLFKGKKAYRTFIFDQAEYQRSLWKIKHLMLE